MGAYFSNSQNIDSKRKQKSSRDVVIRQKTMIAILQKINDNLSKTLEEEMQYKNYVFFILEKEYSKENEFY